MFLVTITASAVFFWTPDYLYSYTVWLFFSSYQAHLQTNAGIITESDNLHLGARRPPEAPIDLCLKNSGFEGSKSRSLTFDPQRWDVQDFVKPKGHWKLRCLEHLKKIGWKCLLRLPYQRFCGVENCLIRIIYSGFEGDLGGFFRTKIWGSFWGPDQPWRE